MNCQAVQSSLSLYLYGELDFSSEEQIENHLAACAACQLSLAREKQWHTFTKAEVQEPPLDLLAQCRQQLRPSLVPPSEPRQRARWSFPFEISFNRWSSQLAFASLFLFMGFAAARWLDRAATQPSINPANALIRNIQTDDAGLVRILVDQPSEIAGRIDDANIRSLLLSGARQPDPAVRFYSVQILNQQSIAGQRSDDLRQLLVDTVRNDPNPAIRLEAIDGLRRFSADPTAVETIRFVLQHDDNPGVRYQAFDILTPASLVPVY